jgi:hypothetical protein
LKHLLPYRLLLLTLPMHRRQLPKLRLLLQNNCLRIICRQTNRVFTEKVNARFFCVFIPEQETDCF